MFRYEMTGEIKEGPTGWWYIDFNKSFLQLDIMEWLDGNCKEDYIYVSYNNIPSYTLNFRKYEDAVAFKMVWF